MIGSPRGWRETPQRYRYQAERCEKCGHVHFPPRQVCMECSGRTFSPHTLSETGTLETFTVIRVAPTGFTDEVPYAVGIVTLDDGVRVTAQVTDCDPADLGIGTRLRREFRRVCADGATGVLHYGYKFVPLQ